MRVRVRERETGEKKRRKGEGERERERKREKERRGEEDTTSRNSGACGRRENEATLKALNSQYCILDVLPVWCAARERRRDLLTWKSIPS